MRGSRVQAVSNEIAGERVDIIPWDENPAQFVINAMSPAEVISIVVDEDSHSMDIAVSEEKLSQAIGRGGQNIRLASELTGWRLNVMSEQQAEEKSEGEQRELREMFMRLLDNAFNYHVHGRAGFDRLGELVEQCDCLEFTYSRLEDAARLFDRLEREGASAVLDGAP